jgi:stringent starvation protein B
MNGNPPPPKKEVALALLERGSVHVHLDPRASGVVVPAWFKRQPQLVLQVGLNMPVPIPDLRVDEDGMSCTLSFNRSPFFCIVPWSSVYAMVGDDGRGMVWPEDVPPEVAMQGRARATGAEQAAKKPSPERPLAVVKSPPASPGKAAPKARPRAARAGATAEVAEKKPRAKKPRVAPAEPRGAGPAAPTAPTAKGAHGRTGEGVLIQIPPAAKPARAPSPAPAPRPLDPRQEPAATNGGVVDGSARGKPRPAGAPSSAGPNKPGKVKREIPPYLRVVK